ncbi:3'-5' exonuclease [Polyangium mundeleinium]|uniref:Exonuclease domain-containing protein n=1 Tax=Polyangium mundeleinium TaxID=2995306 RepID=A0ABT5EUL1_9BACT|nr:3'-5' exonuclease [Polyangium mundeleinium]MDC0744446.1 exonuclease domain-containing protein [Polyangium mundeleinium]
MSKEPAFFLVIDLEATCDEEGRIPEKIMEIIEIGAVLVDGATLEPVGEFATFVRPVIRPTLTAFCKKLTTITQADVDGAPTFPAAIEALGRFVGDRDALFGSWGDYDRKQFEIDATRWGVPLPLQGHMNIKKRFSAALGETTRYGMASALERLALPLLGTHHRGIDDARNIARILPYAIGRVPIPAAQPTG